MRRVEILLDDETDQILTTLAESYGGDISEAIRQVLRAHGLSDEFLDEFEAQHGTEMLRQIQRSEQDFREGRFTTLEDVKRRAGL